MREHRNEPYPAAPPVPWNATCKQRQARREAVDARNELIGTVGAARAVEIVGGGSIGAGKPKAAKKP